MSNQIVISSGAKVRSLNGVITGTTGVLDSLPINASNGIPQLDVNGKILVSQLPNSVMEYQGTWNANTNTPTLTNGGAFNQGDVYLCNVAGTTDFGAGPIAFVVGDQVIYSGSIWQRASGASGTVTSVAVTESGDALTITGSPITTSGTINIGFAGISSQYVAGNGALITFPTLTGYVPYTGATQDVDLGAFKLNAQSLHAKGTAGNGHLGLKHQSASATASANEASLFADSLGDLSWLNGNIYLSKFITSSNTAARSYTFPNANGTVALTSDISYPVTSVFGRTGAVVATEGDYSLTQLSDVTITSPSNGQVLKYNGTAWVNDSDTDTGITSLNGLTALTQTFAVGTSGTDFAISSATATHTFNLPTASAANRGALSSADWTTFNNKQSTLSLTTTGNSGSATLVSNTLNVPTYTLAGLGGISLTSLSATTPLSYNNTTGAFSIQVANTSQDGYLSSTDWNTFNSKQSTITNPVTGTGTSGQVTYFNGTSSVTSSSNFKFDGTNLTIGNPSSALAQLHVFNASAAASFLLQTNSTTDYSEIAVRNNSSTATSYFRQYSTAATGSDFGISRAGLALFFSNYATNFAIGTRNGGDLILGTADTERARMFSATGNLSLNSSSDAGYKLDVNGTGRFTGALNGTSATFSGNVNVGTNIAQLLPITTTNFQILTGCYYDGSNIIATATSGTRIISNAGSFTFNNFTGATIGGSVTDTARLTISSTGAATFSSSVTAAGLNATIAKSGTGVESINLLNLRITGTGAIGDSENIRFLNPDGINIATISGILGGDNVAYGSLAFSIRNYNTDALTEAMRINNRGNVGIGTSSPSYILHAQATSANVAYFNRTTTDGDVLTLAVGGTNAFVFNTTSGVRNIQAPGAVDMTMWTNGTERMRITSGGNVLVNTSTDDGVGRVSVVGPIATRGSGSVLYFQNQTSTNYFAWYGSGTQIRLFNQDVGVIGYFNASTGAYTASSDINRKKDFEDSTIGLNAILGLKPTLYRMKDEIGTKKHLGFIAQEVKEFIPQAYNETTDAKGTFIGLDFNPIVAALVKAIQEQQKQIEELKAKING